MRSLEGPASTTGTDQYSKSYSNTSFDTFPQSRTDRTAAASRPCDATRVLIRFRVRRGEPVGGGCGLDHGHACLYVDLDRIRQRISRQKLRKSARGGNSFTLPLYIFRLRRTGGMATWMGRVHVEGDSTAVAAGGDARRSQNGGASPKIGRVAFKEGIVCHIGLECDDRSVWLTDRRTARCCHASLQGRYVGAERLTEVSNTLRVKAPTCPPRSSQTSVGSTPRTTERHRGPLT